MRFTELFRAILNLAKHGETRKRSVCHRVFRLGLLSVGMLAAQGPLRITTSSLPAGVVGTPYQGIQLTATGGSGSYSWTWGGTPLPPGLQLSSSGYLSGTPRVTGSYTVGVTVSDLSFSVSPASTSFTISITASGATPTVVTSLPQATLGQAYSQTLVSGGAPPYTLTVTSGSLPAGLTFTASTGVLSGTPTTGGTFSFSVQVSDANKQSASGTVTLTVSGPALQITNPVGPLFNGTAGTPYTPTTFNATGGTQPYTWSIVSGNSDGLTMSSTGVLSGTPQTDGSFSFTVQVTDAAGATASQPFSIVVNKPSLSITAGSFPAGAVGAAYNQTTAAATVTGGTPPYTWSLISGSVPGLTFVPANVAFTGTPTTPGTFNITLQVTDAAGLTATKGFTVTIGAAALTITGTRQLPNATLNVPYSQQLSATGGSAPYNWSANGLPKGLTINSSTGLISGTPTAAGNFPIIVITVIDNALKTYQDNFSLSVNLPTVPAISVSGLPATSDAASQFPLKVSISSAYSNDITGNLIIGFQPNTGLSDSTIQFSTGGKTASFIIPAGSTSATFLDSNGIPVQQLQIQTGTVAGSINVSLSNVTAATVDITPTPAPSTATQITAQAPVVSNVAVTRDGNGGCPKGQLCLAVTGFATSREVTQAVYTFNAAAGQSLQTSAGSITVDVGSAFTSWFSSSTIGSQFILSQPFTINGDPNSVIPVSLTLTNRVGSTTYKIN
jgi:hypothetical protein